LAFIGPLSDVDEISRLETLFSIIYRLYELRDIYSETKILLSFLLNWKLFVSLCQQLSWAGKG